MCACIYTDTKYSINVYIMVYVHVCGGSFVLRRGTSVDLAGAMTSDACGTRSMSCGAMQASILYGILSSLLFVQCKT